MQTAVTAFTANKVANAHTAGTGLTGTAFDGSAAQTWTLNTATLMAEAVTARSVPNSSLTGSGALTVTAGTGLTGGGSVALGGSTTLTLNTATLMQTAVTALTASGSAGSVANSHTAGTGLSGTAFNGSAAVTWTLNTATLMAEASTARSVAGANVSGNITGNAANVTGVVAIANGGTGESSRQAAMDALAGAVTSGQYLRGNGSDVVMSAIQAGDVPTLNQNTNGSAGSVANALTIGSGLGGTSYNGSSAVTITLTTATLMTRSVNLAGGTAGQLAYQTGAGATAFAGPGTAGQLLMSAGTSAPTYTNTASIYVARAVTADNLVGGSSISGNLTVTGNLTVQGTTTVVNSTVTNISDPIITIGGGAGGAAPSTDDNKDRGIAFQWHNGTTAKVGFFGYDDSTGYLTFVPDATITNEVISGTVGDIQATNFRGTLVGSISNALTIGSGLGGTSYNGSGAVTITNTGVLSNVAGTGISVSGATGNVTITNTGVTSNVAGTGISVSAGTGAVTVSNTGVLTITGTTNQVLVNSGISSANGNITLTLPQSIGIANDLRFNSLGIGTAASGTGGEIRATNEITAYYSDRRLKENVKVIDNAVDKVLSLNGITYTPNEVAESFGYDRTVKLVGLFADEVEAVLPEATRPAPFDQDENGNSKSGENYKTIQYEKLVPLLIEAIKEQQQQIAQLSETINTLVNK
jgi:hypothetical protein